MIAPVFNQLHLEAAAAAGATPLIFDTETLLAAQEQDAQALSPRDVIERDDDVLRRLHREAIDAFAAFASGDDPGVAPLSPVMYRHARWIAKAIVPAFVASRAGAAHRPNRPLRVTHLLDGQPAGLADDTLLAIALGAAGVSADIVPALPGPPAPRAASPPARLERTTLFVAGPVELRFMTRIAQAWAEHGDGTAPRVVTKEGETELLGEAAPAPRDPLDRRPLLESSSTELRTLLWTNAGLEPHLDFLATTYAAAMRRQIARWARLLEGGGVERIVAAYPCVALDVARALGVPTALLPHGPMVTAEDDLYRLTPATVVAAIGAAHAARLRTLGIAAPATGLPASASAPAEADAAPPSELLLLTVEPARPRDAGSLPRIWPDREIAAMRSLAEAVRRRGWRLRLRRHPRYDRSPSFYRAIFGSSLDLSPPDRPLAADIAASGLLLSFSGPSSVILDATRAGAPFLLGTASWAFASLEDWGLTRWPNASDAGELERTIASALASDEALAAMRRRSAAALRAFDGGELNPLGEILALLRETQPRATTRTIREIRSTASARG